MAGVLLAEEPIRYSFHAFFTKRMIPVENAFVLNPKTTDSVSVSSQVRLMPTSHHNHRIPFLNKTLKSNIAPTWSLKRNSKLAPKRTDEFHNAKTASQTFIERSRENREGGGRYTVSHAEKIKRKYFFCVMH